MASPSGSHLLLFGCALLAPRIASKRLLDALGVLKHPLYAPKAAARDHRGLQGTRGFRIVDRRHGQRDCWFSGARRDVPERADRQEREQRNPDTARRTQGIAQHARFGIEGHGRLLLNVMRLCRSTSPELTRSAYAAPRASA